MCNLLAFAAVAFLLGGEAGGDAAPAAPTRSAAVAFEGIRIFPQERRLEVDAAFAIVGEQYFLEYAAVAPHGKLHESLLEMRCPPEKLQLGLILMGLEPRPEVEYHGEARALSGPRVAIEAEWGAGEGKKRARLEDLLFDVRFGRPMERTGFAFTGSRFVKAYGRGAGADGKPSEIFAATASGSAIALYHDPDAVLDNPLLTGGDVPLLSPTFKLVEIVGWVPGDERLRPLASKLPPHGTPAVLHMRPQ